MFNDRSALEAQSLSSAWSAYLGDHLALARVLGRYKMYLDTRDVAVASHILLDGFWESWISMFMVRHLRPGWVCIDAGAHAGYFTLLMADLVGSEGQILAVEPNPGTSELLVKNARLNGFHHVEVFRAALGSAKELDYLISGDDNSGNAYLASTASRRLTRFSVEIQTPVKVIPLASLYLPQVDFIKLDIEGSEEAAWRGMESILELHPNAGVLMQFEAARFIQPEQFLKKLIDQGFKLRMVDLEGFPQPIEPETLLTDYSSWMLWLVRY